MWLEDGEGAGSVEGGRDDGLGEGREERDVDEGTGRTGGAELEVVEKVGSENDGGAVDVVVVVVSGVGALLDAEVEAGRAGRLRALPRAGRYRAAPETSSGRSPRLRVMVPSAPEAELGDRWKLCT